MLKDKVRRFLLQCSDYYYHILALSAASFSAAPLQSEWHVPRAIKYREPMQDTEINKLMADATPKEGEEGAAPAS